MKTLANNRRAVFDYQILEKFEAGIALLGHEVKAIRIGRISIAGSYVVLKGEEVFLINCNIPPYQPKNTPSDYDPKRSRKLLLKKREIRRLLGKKKEEGLTLVPLKVYTKNKLIKVEVGLAKGKKKFDKREAIKKREAERNIKRALARKI